MKNLVLSTTGKRITLYENHVEKFLCDKMIGLYHDIDNKYYYDDFQDNHVLFLGKFENEEKAIEKFNEEIEELKKELDL